MAHERLLVVSEQAGNDSLDPSRLQRYALAVTAKRAV
jgi:hypothetical protein